MSERVLCQPYDTVDVMSPLPYYLLVINEEFRITVPSNFITSWLGPQSTPTIFEDLIHHSQAMFTSSSQPKPLHHGLTRRSYPSTPTQKPFLPSYHPIALSNSGSLPILPLPLRSYVGAYQILRLQACVRLWSICTHLVVLTKCSSQQPGVFERRSRSQSLPSFDCQQKQ